MKSIVSLIVLSMLVVLISVSYTGCRVLIEWNGMVFLFLNRMWPLNMVNLEVLMVQVLEPELVPEQELAQESEVSVKL